MCKEYRDVFVELWNRWQVVPEERRVPFPPIAETLKMKLFYSEDGRGASHCFYVPEKDWSIAGFTIYRPEGFVVIARAWVNQEFKGKGLGKFLAAMRVAAFRKLIIEEPCAENGLEMICRCAPTNEKQIHILQSCGWEKLSEWIWRVKK